MNQFTRHIDVAFIFVAAELCAFLVFFLLVADPHDSRNVVDAVFTLINLFVGFMTCFVWFTVCKEPDIDDEERIPLLI